MISHIEGRVAEKRAGELVIDVNGVGFLLLCPASTIAAAPAAGETFRCYTHFSVYDGGMDLYGFSSKEDREMFRRLCSVSGIGARTALGILSTLSLRDLSLAILTGDATSIARAPNVGKKTAQRIILELKDKVDQQDVDMGGGVRAGSRAGAARARLLRHRGAARRQFRARQGRYGRYAHFARPEGIRRLTGWKTG